MTKLEYLIELAKKLEALDIQSDDLYPETRRLVGFYQEMIEDRIEEGLSEEEAVAGMEPVEEIVERVRRELSVAEGAPAPEKPAESAQPGTSARADGKYTHMTRTFDGARIRRVALADQNRAVEVAVGDALKIEYVDGPEGHYDVELVGDDLYIRFVANPWGGLRSIFAPRPFQPRAFRLTLPKQSGHLDVEVRTSNGGITVTRPALTTGVFRTSNGKIDAVGVAAERVRFVTSNGGVTLKGIAAQSIVAESSNARMAADKLSADEIVLKTSNGANEAIQIAASSIRMETHNGHLSVQNISGDDITLASSNGAVTGTIRGNAADFAITSRTSNGKNNLPAVSEGAKKLDVRTSNARIDIQFT